MPIATRLFKPGTYGLGGRVLPLAVSIVSLLLFSEIALGQKVGETPSLRADQTHKFTSSRVPLHSVNAGLRRAGLSELGTESPYVNPDGTVTLYHEVPTPKARRIPERRSRELPVGPLAASPAPMPFTVTSGDSLDGIDFIDNSGYSGGFLFIPPDPMGAAGMSHVVEVVNVGIRVFEKGTTTVITDTALARQGGVDSTGFFGSLGPLTSTFDPKVVYDQYEDRFLVVTLERTAVSSGAAQDTSLVYLAVSDDGTPDGTCGSGWFCTKISTDITGVCPGGANAWFDYPGFEMDEEAVYITGNLFNFPATAFCGNRLIVVDKGTAAGFYAGGAATFGIFDPWTAGGFVTGTHQPAKTYGSPPAGLGTFLVMYSGLTLGGPGATEAMSVIEIDTPIPLGGISFTQAFVVQGDIEDVGGSFGFPALPDAPQASTDSLVEVNDRRTLDAVYRDTSLYVTTTIHPNFSPDDTLETTAYWAELAGSGVATMALAQSGIIGGEDIAADTYTFFPAIEVNPDTVVGIGFSASASSIFPGAYFTGREPSDSPGVTGPVGVVDLGVDFYNRKFSGPRNRWGDYSGAALDPANTDCFWFTNEWADERGNGTAPDDGQWATTIREVCFEPTGLPVEMSSFRAVVDDGDVVLLWQTESEENNAGFEVHQRTASENENWVRAGFVEGVGSTIESQIYKFRIEDPLPGSYQFRLKQIDFDGAFEYSEVVEATVELPYDYILTEAYPNPFNPTTQFSLVVAREQKVRIEVFNTLGQRVTVLHDGPLAAKKQHRFSLRAGSLPSGVYLYRAVGESFVSGTYSVTLLK